MNKLIDRIEKLQAIDTFILMQKEATVSEMAELLGMSRRRIYSYFKIMKDLGAPVSIKHGGKNRVIYKTPFRLSARINTTTKIVPPTACYKKIKDTTLKKLIFFNKVDEFIFEGKTGATRSFAKKLKLRNHKECSNRLYDFKNMGADYYFDATKQTYRYARRKRFNIILQVLPFDLK